MKTVRVTIKNGRPTIEVSGVSGESCKAMTQKLESALGVTTSDEPTSEMYHDNTQNQDQ